jgi:pimeloyl-ACP methyl ester carboxylesterase
MNGPSRTRRRFAAIPLAILALTLALSGCLELVHGGGGGGGPTPAPSKPLPTVVLVHGAWADASGWNAVSSELQSKGYKVIAPANPLRSLAGDSAYLASILAQTPGPIVLVGHSYGGAVITNAADGNANVKALVYVSAFIPDIGEDILHLGGAQSQVADAIEFKGFPPYTDADADIYLRQDKFRATFAADIPAKDAAVMAASQRPIAVPAGASPTAATAWRSIPSWSLVSTQDKAIGVDQQRMMSKRAGATTVEVKSSHASMISHPGAVTKLIVAATKATV